ncbi:hypothetical protein VPH35_007022 [Triticum aestivum]
MTVLCARQHYLLGGVVLETQTTTSVAMCGCGWCVLLQALLFGWPTCGLRPASMHAHDPVLLRPASGFWSCLGSSLLNDDAMTPPRLANRLELSWQSAQSRFVLSFGTRFVLSFGTR